MVGKRLFDILCASLGTLSFLPVLLVISCLILLEDGGPVFFRQVRLGKDKKPFTIIKFRSMHDGKVTRVGRWIRSTGLDEVMQFINVLKGEMSMVGPRPLTDEDVMRLGWNNSQVMRFQSRPGITGLSQLYAGKGARVSAFLDQRYNESNSFTLDLTIIGLSLLVNLLGKRRVKNMLSELRHAKRANKRHGRRLDKEHEYSSQG